MKFLVLGSTGILSNVLRKVLKKNVIFFSRSSDSKELKTNIFSSKFNPNNDIFFRKLKEKDIIILLSNLGNLKEYENKKKRDKFIFSINNNLFKNLKNNKIIFISSDYIFFGIKKNYNDYSIPKPKNHYGKVKYKIEMLIKKNFKNYIILRFPKIYSLNKSSKSFPIGYFNNRIQNVFIDQMVSFLDCRNLLEFLKLLLKKIIYINGCYNIPGNFFGSRFNFLNKIILANNIHNNLNPIKMPKKYKKMLPIYLKTSTYLFKKIKFKYTKFNFKLYS